MQMCAWPSHWTDGPFHLAGAIALYTGFYFSVGLGMVTDPAAARVMASAAIALTFYSAWIASDYRKLGHWNWAGWLWPCGGVVLLTAVALQRGAKQQGRARAAPTQESLHRHLLALAAVHEADVPEQQHSSEREPDPHHGVHWVEHKGTAAQHHGQSHHQIQRGTQTQMRWPACHRRGR